MWSKIDGLFVNSRGIFDLRALEDPIALKTDWGPLVSSGWNICTHRLSSIQGKRHMQVAPMSHLFCLFCISLGVVISAFVTDQLNNPSPSAVTSGNMPLWLVPIFPYIFSAYGIGMHWWLYRKNVLFDKKKGVYVRQGRSFSLDEVHAIQLIGERCYGNNQFNSYEMNLVLKTGERFSVTDHGSLRGIRVDSERLAEYLGIPVWDLVDYDIRTAMH